MAHLSSAKPREGEAGKYRETDGHTIPRTAGIGRGVWGERLGVAGGKRGSRAVCRGAGQEEAEPAVVEVSWCLFVALRKALAWVGKER